MADKRRSRYENLETKIYYMKIPNKLEKAMLMIDAYVTLGYSGILRVAILDWATTKPLDKLENLDPEKVKVDAEKKDTYTSKGLVVPIKLLDFVEEAAIYLNMNSATLMKLIIVRFLKKYIPSSLNREWTNESASIKKAHRLSKKLIDIVKEVSTILKHKIHILNTVSAGVDDTYIKLDMYSGNKIRYMRISFNYETLKEIKIEKLGDNGSDIVYTHISEIKIVTKEGDGRDSFIDDLYMMISEVMFKSSVYKKFKNDVTQMEDGFANYMDYKAS